MSPTVVGEGDCSPRISQESIMAERSALKLLPDVHPAQERQAWDLMKDQASILVKTGFLPEAIKTPEQAMAVMMKGRELSIPPMYALSNIAIVKGKPSCSAELMLALIRRDHGASAIRVKVTDNQRCVVEWRQKGWDGTQSYSFTIEDAKQAQLVISGGNWTKYPAAMLRARCLSAVARMAFPESIAGMYTPGELGDEVVVTDDGEVMSSGIAAAPAPVTPRPFEAMQDHVVIDVESRPVTEHKPKTDHELALDRFFAVSGERGFTNAGNKLFAIALRPMRENGPTTSRKQLTAQELRDLVQVMEDNVEPATRDENKKILFVAPPVEFANAIADATDQTRLADIGAKLKEGGISAPWLRKMFKHRREEVPAVAEGAAS